jgi:hypothetical protein
METRWILASAKIISLRDIKFFVLFNHSREADNFSLKIFSFPRKLNTAYKFLFLYPQSDFASECPSMTTEAPATTTTRRPGTGGNGSGNTTAPEMKCCGEYPAR